MSDYRPDIPRIDDTTTPRNLHDRAERVAVPSYDWFNETLLGIVDGLTHLRRHHATPPAEPDGSPHAGPGERPTPAH
ncbi:hypothetical protein [Mangrovihabitans endophyticus]|uniref:Uncharacterized protein n=1 Tax=Mangrovihabitans endophyticus TaxID=1751298 RepID=A0A8J3C2Q6_9ACTN|nr:hypothetical protein [Mangrovihabitans endophyticus]GGK99818.1 hypothetical protein GCM10012284_37800 [Mangrovihabitans endophyticus]